MIAGGVGERNAKKHPSAYRIWKRQKKRGLSV
jgi:hypothetical protein